MNTDTLKQEDMERSTRGGWVGRFLTGTGLPLFLLALTLVYEAFLIAVLLVPPGWGVLGGFAQEFKVWCFSYDPRTGGMEWAAVWMMILEPVFIVGIVLVLWRKTLRGIFRRDWWAQHLRPTAAGLATGLLAVTVIYWIGAPSGADAEPLPFPGERIRTTLTPPAFELTDQEGASVRLQDFEGKVVLITGVYSHCTAGCPMILIELRTLLDDLPEDIRVDLQVIALSLDPERDTRELMGRVSSAYNLSYPEFRFLNGDPDTMSGLLRRYQFSPVLNPKTGVIDHANLFILVDAEGRIAYRFNLDPRHAPWLRAAVVDLVEEARELRPHGLASSEP